MRIFVERTGGIAGLNLKGTVDTSTLPISQARRLEQLLKKSDFFNLPPVLDSEQPGADRFSYKVTVETATKSYTVQAGEAAVPLNMRPLLEFLTRSIKLRTV